MLKDFIYEFLLQLCEGVQGWAKVKERKIDFEHYKEYNVERMTYPHLRFVCPSYGVCGDNILVIRYNESAFIHKTRKCIHKRDEYFQ